MSPDLEDVLRRGRLSALDIIAFIDGPNVPRSWDKAWMLNDRIAHIAQDALWCAAVAEASQLDTQPSRLLAHEEPIRIRAAQGAMGSPNYWGDTGRALTLRPTAVAVDLSMAPAGGATVRLHPKGKPGKDTIERTSTNPAAAICWVVLTHLGRTDPFGASLSLARAARSPFCLDLAALQRAA